MVSNRTFTTFVGFAAILLSVAAPLHGQYAGEARAALRAPSKVAVRTLQQSPLAGDPVDFNVQLQNGRGEPATLPNATPIGIQLLASSGAVVQSGTCAIPAHTSDARCTLRGPEPGVYKVRAQPQNRSLLEGTGYVMVRARGPGAKRKGEAAPHGRVPLLLAAYRPAGELLEEPPQAAGACDPPKSRSGARVVLTINEGGESHGAFRAGLDPATIVAFFQADDGGSAPSDIFVWMTPDHGELDQQPLVIHACSIVGESHLSSKYPVHASLMYKVVPATYAVEAPPKLEASFVRPIIGIGVMPSGTQRLSLIDRAPIVVQFFDADGNAVPSDLERTVQFVSNNSVIGAKSESVKLKAGDFTAETLLLPFWVGSGSIFVTADRLKPATHPVEVVGLMVIGVCLLGGLMGGLVSFFGTGGSFYRRLIVGTIAGIVLTWAYVFGILPRVDAGVAHNYISVFVVSVLGGYLGIKAFDIVLKQMGWAT